MSMTRVLSVAAFSFLLLASCRRTVPTTNPAGGALQTTVNSNVVPRQQTVDATPVGASRDQQNIQSDFREGIVLVRPKNAADLQAFLQRFDGQVLGDDKLPEPPPEMGVALSDEQRQPTQYTVRINLAKVNVSALPANADKVGLRGRLEFSSQAAMQTLSAIVEAKAAGFRATADYVYEGHQAFPQALFSTQERQTSAGPPIVYTDPFTAAGYSDFGATGNQSNVYLAWQYVAAHGIARRTRVAVIDNGFYLDNAGLALGTDSDFTAPPTKAMQYDFTNRTYIASGPNSMGCGNGNPCWWHGTGSAGVATGIANNQLGDAGTGGFVADPILFRVSGTRSTQNRAIRTALAWGADVISMSYGGDCNLSCRMDDRDDTPFDDAVNSGSKAVFVASAGNGRGNPAAGYDVGDPSFVHPCIEDHVICIGALNPGALTKIGYSNFGGQVQIFAPTTIPIMSIPPSANPAGTPLPLSQAYGVAAPRTFGGTSASAPFVAGVVAMMKSLNPNLGPDDVARILRETAQPGGDGQVTRVLNAFAAVKRAAEGTALVADASEPNDITPTNLGSAASYSRNNLNLDGRDRDYFRFDSPGGGTMTLQLVYPAGLGDISVLSLESVTGACGRPVLISQAPIASGGKTYTYQVPGGAMTLGLRAADVNAYNLAISFGSRAYAADSYEPNDTPATAKRLSSISVAGGALGGIKLEPRITIDATLHNNTDIDFYTVRGAKMSSAEKVLISGYPALRVSGNDSRLTLEVFRLNPDNTPGASVASVTGESCMASALSVRLDEDVNYLVKISGGAGAYTLRNGVDGDARSIPVLVHDRIWEILHPGEPIEHVIRVPELYVFPGNRAARAIRSAGSNVQLTLFDDAGNRVAEGVPGPNGETLALGETNPEKMYTLEARPKEIGAEPVRLNLQWDLARDENSPH